MLSAWIPGRDPTAKIFIVSYRLGLATNLTGAPGCSHSSVITKMQFMSPGRAGAVAQPGDKGDGAGC